MCVDEPRIWGEYRCGDLLEKLPACQDALALAIEDNTTTNRINGREKCNPFDEDGFKLALRNRYDRREEHVSKYDLFSATHAQCFPIHKCFWWFEPLQSLMNTEALRRLVSGSPSASELTMTPARRTANRRLPVADHRTRLSELSQRGRPVGVFSRWVFTCAAISRPIASLRQSWKQAPVSSVSLPPNAH